MRTVLLETNAINQCLSKTISGSQLASLLDKKCLHPVINIHTTYELARSFLNPKSHDKGKKLFTILRELKPIFSCFTRELIQREIIKLREDKNVNFFCTKIVEKQLLKAIVNLSNGWRVNDYEKKIREREDNFKAEQKVWDMVISLKKKEAQKFSNYEEFIENYMQPNNLEKIKNRIFQHSEYILTDSEIMKFLTESVSYPALYTLIRAEMYLNYICISSGNRPAKDKTDDFRHLIDASYCSVLVTDDAGLSSIACNISPGKEILTFSELIA